MKRREMVNEKEENGNNNRNKKIILYRILIHTQSTQQISNSIHHFIRSIILYNRVMLVLNG